MSELVSQQPSPKVRAGLSTYQTCLLKATPKFEWEPLDRTWQTTLVARTPDLLRPPPPGTRLRTTNKTETALARWALAQRIAVNNRTLTTSQESVLWSAKHPVL